MLINGQKWACETCIKGHRASNCNHTNRQLLQIKRKGRPSTQCNRCKELRIVRQLHVKCNCSQTNNSNSDISGGSGDSKTPKKKRRTTKLRPLAPKEVASKSTCNSNSKTQPSATFSMPIATTTSIFSTSIVNNASLPALMPVPTSVSTPVSASKSCCSGKIKPIAPPIVTPSTTSCCSNKEKVITPPIMTPTTTSCCSDKAKAQTASSSQITNESFPYHNSNNNHNMFNQLQSSASPIQNSTSPQEEKEDVDANHHTPSREISPIFTSSTSSTSTVTYDANSSDPLSPYIPPPTSCCGPPTKNKNGENIRIVTCRCGDSCACPGCDAHPSRAMKEGTKDVYYGFQAVTNTPSSSSSSSSSTSSSISNSSKRIPISKICSSDAENDRNEKHNITSPQPRKSTAAKCGCGCDQLFENCFGCLNDLCQCSFGANMMEMGHDSEHESRFSL